MLKTILVLLATSYGDITLELYPDKAPKSVENFVTYVNEGHYNGTTFHRVIDGFMIQGGGYTPDMTQKKTRTPIENEAKNGLHNERGTIAMARTGNPHSATSQFFINTVNNGPLDYPKPDGWGYAVFGRVTAGMDVVDKIEKVRTGMQDRPMETVLIKEARILPAFKSMPAVPAEPATPKKSAAATQ